MIAVALLAHVPAHRDGDGYGRPCRAAKPLRQVEFGETRVLLLAVQHAQTASGLSRKSVSIEKRG